MLKQIIFISALMAAFLNAHAQSSSAPFGVTGTITPGACSVALTGGVVNLGTLSAATVKAYGQASGVYHFPGVNLPISITCGAPTKVEASFIDNHTSDKYVLDQNDVVRFGIVDGAGTKGIGFYTMIFSNTTIDNVAVGQFLNAPNGTANWTSTVPGTGVPAIYASHNNTIGFSKTAGATTPDSFTTLTGTLSFQSYASINYVNNATTAIALNGSGTLTLVYL